MYKSINIWSPATHYLGKLASECGEYKSVTVSDRGQNYQEVEEGNDLAKKADDQTTTATMTSKAVTTAATPSEHQDSHGGE